MSGVCLITAEMAETFDNGGTDGVENEFEIMTF